MKMNFTKKIMATSLTVISLLGVSSNVFAQDTFTSFILGSRADAEKVLTAYTSPMLKGFGHGINAGWNNTAKPHKLLGFDATLTISGVQIPDAETVFTFNNADYTTMALGGGSTSAEMPTIFGPSESPTGDVINLTFDPGNGLPVQEQPIPLTGFGFKEQIGYNFIPVPMVSVGVGLIKGTELRFRYMPTYDLGGAGSLSLFGIGVKHDIKQWIPGIKHLPFDLSGFVGYTTFKIGIGIDSEEATIDSPVQLRNPNDNQEVAFASTGTVFQALVSKKLLFVTPYVGLGYTRMSTEFKIAGDYDVWALNNTGTQYEQANPGDATTPIKDPIVLKVSEGSLQGIVGMRLKILWVLAIHAEYTLQKYNTFTVGFGINIR